jgi:hypothetical protein
MGKLGRWVARVGLPVANSSQAATTEDSQKPLPLTFEAGHDFVAFFLGGYFQELSRIMSDPWLSGPYLIFRLRLFQAITI